MLRATATNSVSSSQDAGKAREPSRVQGAEAPRCPQPSLNPAQGGPVMNEALCAQVGGNSGCPTLGELPPHQGSALLEAPTPSTVTAVAPTNDGLTTSDPAATVASRPHHEEARCIVQGSVPPLLITPQEAPVAAVSVPSMLLHSMHPDRSVAASPARSVDEMFFTPTGDAFALDEHLIHLQSPAPPFSLANLTTTATSAGVMAGKPQGSQAPEPDQSTHNPPVLPAMAAGSPVPVCVPSTVQVPSIVPVPSTVSVPSTVQVPVSVHGARDVQATPTAPVPVSVCAPPVQARPPVVPVSSGEYLGPNNFGFTATAPAVVDTPPRVGRVEAAAAAVDPNLVTIIDMLTDLRDRGGRMDLNALTFLNENLLGGSHIGPSAPYLPPSPKSMPSRPPSVMPVAAKRPVLSHLLADPRNPGFHLQVPNHVPPVFAPGASAYGPVERVPVTSMGGEGPCYVPLQPDHPVRASQSGYPMSYQPPPVVQQWEPRMYPAPVMSAPVYPAQSYPIHPAAQPYADPFRMQSDFTNRRTQFIFQTPDKVKFAHNNFSGYDHVKWARDVVDGIRINQSYEEMSNLHPHRRYTHVQFLSEFVMHCTVPESSARQMCEGEWRELFNLKASTRDRNRDPNLYSQPLEFFFVEDILPTFDAMFKQASDREWNALRNMTMGLDLNLRPICDQSVTAYVDRMKLAREACGGASIVDNATYVRHIINGLRPIELKKQMQTREYLFFGLGKMDLPGFCKDADGWLSWFRQTSHANRTSTSDTTSRSHSRPSIQGQPSGQSGPPSSAHNRSATDEIPFGDCDHPKHKGMRVRHNKVDCRLYAQDNAPAPPNAGNQPRPQYNNPRPNNYHNNNHRAPGQPAGGAQPAAPPNQGPPRHHAAAPGGGQAGPHQVGQGRGGNHQGNAPRVAAIVEPVSTAVICAACTQSTQCDPHCPRPLNRERVRHIQELGTALHTATQAVMFLSTTGQLPNHLWDSLSAIQQSHPGEYRQLYAQAQETLESLETAASIVAPMLSAEHAEEDQASEGGVMVTPGMVRRAVEYYERPYKRAHSSWVQSSPSASAHNATGPAGSSPITQSTLLIDFAEVSSATSSPTPVVPMSSSELFTPTPDEPHTPPVSPVVPAFNPADYTPLESLSVIPETPLPAQAPQGQQNPAAMDTPAAAAVLLGLQNLPTTPTCTQLLQSPPPAALTDPNPAEPVSVGQVALTGGDYDDSQDSWEGYQSDSSIQGPERSPNALESRETSDVSISPYDLPDDGDFVFNDPEYSGSDSTRREHAKLRETPPLQFPPLPPVEVITIDTTDPAPLCLPNIGPLPADHVPFKQPAPNFDVERDRFLHPDEWQNRPGGRPLWVQRPAAARGYDMRSVLVRMCYLWEVAADMVDALLKECEDSATLTTTVNEL